MAAALNSDDTFSQEVRASEFGEDLSAALAALYFAGPPQVELAAPYVVERLGVPSLCAIPESKYNPQHRGRVEFQRYVDASGFPRMLARALASLRRKSGKTDAVTADVKAHIERQLARRDARRKERADAAAAAGQCRLGAKPWAVVDDDLDLEHDDDDDNDDAAKQAADDDAAHTVGRRFYGIGAQGGGGGGGDGGELDLDALQGLAPGGAGADGPSSNPALDIYAAEEAAAANEASEGCE